MKKLFLLLISALCVTDGLFAQVLVPSQLPNHTQKLLMKRGYGMFIHFGVNTFSDDEWSDGTIPATAYNPADLDCEDRKSVV